MLGGLVSLLVVQGYVLPALLATVTGREPQPGRLPAAESVPG
jgi:hypothetical protein